VSTAEILRAARALIEKPEAWVQKQYRAYADEKCEVVTGYCLVGALTRGEVIGPRCLGSDDEFWRAYECVADQSRVTPEVWNDAPGRTHAEVLALLDRAIAAAEAQS
jgi:hypothetical protein